MIPKKKIVQKKSSLKENICENWLIQPKGDIGQA
jgi:hypothetical protein